MPPNLLDRLLRAEATLRRRRHLLGSLIGAVVVAIAVADARVWPGISLAFGYSVPIVLCAYAFGIRRGVQLSVLCVALRTTCAGRSYGPWWLYAGSAITLAEYLMLTVVVGLLGRAVKRLERHARVMRRLSAHARGLTTTLDPSEVLKRGVEAAVVLAGADGGFVAMASETGWRTDAVLAGGRWRPQALQWPRATGPWEPDAASGPWPTGTSLTHDPIVRQLGGHAQLAVTVPGTGTRPRLAFTVFRGQPRPFERPTLQALELFSLHVAAALNTADLYGAAVRATRDKARLLANVAHELSTPLHVVLAATDLLGSHVTAGGMPYVERLARNTRLLVDIINNLLELARLEAAQPPVRIERVHVPELYEWVRELAQPLLGDKKVRLEVQVDPGAEWVRADPDKLRQILTNLATNAVKYTAAGRVALTAGRDNGCVTLAVRDTGVGIAPGEQERIFDPFYRGRAGGAASGIGLGLALAQDLARLLGTSIVVESRDGAGATFSLALPSADESRAAAPAADDPDTDGMGERGEVAEDDGRQ